MEEIAEISFLKMIPRPIAVIRTKARIEDKTMQMILDTLFIYFSLLFDIKTKNAFSEKSVFFVIANNRLTRRFRISQ